MIYDQIKIGVSLSEPFFKWLLTNKMLVEYITQDMTHYMNPPTNNSRFKTLDEVTKESKSPLASIDGPGWHICSDNHHQLKNLRND